MPLTWKGAPRFISPSAAQGRLHWQIRFLQHVEEAGQAPLPVFRDNYPFPVTSPAMWHPASPLYFQACAELSRGGMTPVDLLPGTSFIF